MFSSKVLLSLAEELELKSSSNKVFGVIDNQYILIQKTSEGYTLTARIEPLSRSFFEGINQTQKICRLIGMKRGQVEFGDNYFIIKGIAPHILPSKTKEKLVKIIEGLTKLLNEKHQFENANTEHTILIEGIPGPNDDGLIKSVEEALIKEALKPINHSLGLIWGSVAGILLGSILGFLSALMIKYANSAINPFGKGLIATALSVFLYKKIAGGVDFKSRILVAFIGLLTFISWDLFDLFFQHSNRSGLLLDGQRLLEIYFNRFSDFSTLSIFSFLAILTILIFCFFLIKGTDRKVVHVEDGELVRGEGVKKAKFEMKLESYTIFFLIAGIISVLISFILSMVGVYEHFEYISLKKLLFLGLFLQIMIMIFVHLIIKRKSSSLLSFPAKTFVTSFKDKYSYFFTVFIFSFVFSLNFSFIASYLNLLLDKSSLAQYKIVTNEEFLQGRHNCHALGFSSEEFGDFKQRVCNGEGNLIKKGEIAIIKAKRGYFDIPYVLELKFPNLDSLASYLSSGREETKLRSNVIRYFYDKDKSKFFLERVQKWESECSINPGSQCRLRAYIYEFEKDEIKALSFYKRGCTNDPISCRGVLTNSVASEDDRMIAQSELSNRCKSGEDLYCMELIWSLWSKGYEENRLEIERLLNESCARGFEEACRNRDG